MDSVACDRCVRNLRSSPVRGISAMRGTAKFHPYGGVSVPVDGSFQASWPDSSRGAPSLSFALARRRPRTRGWDGSWQKTHASPFEQRFRNSPPLIRKTKAHGRHSCGCLSEPMLVGLSGFVSALPELPCWLEFEYSRSFSMRLPPGV